MGYFMDKKYVDQYGGYIGKDGVFHREKDGYVRILLEDGLIYSGCARCMMEYGLCDKAVWYKDKVDTTYCSPYGNFAGTADFPTDCLKKWGFPRVEGA